MARSQLRQVQRGAYLISRAAGDAAAWQEGGPRKYAKRRARRSITRAIFRGLQNLDRG